MSARVCVITGASQGIGLDTALRFARAGYRIVAAARGEEALKSAVEQIIAVGAECEHVIADVGRSEGAQRLIAATQTCFGRVDVLVNNAGYAPLAPLEQMESDDFDAAVAVNIAAVFHTTRVVWPVMRKQGGGVIVNISSLASVDPFPGFAVYGACKAWVNLFSKATADEGRPHNIRVYAVAPGAVETGMLRKRFPDFPAEQTLAPDEVAGVIESLCDERSAPASGSTVWVRK